MKVSDSRTRQREFVKLQKLNSEMADVIELILLNHVISHELYNTAEKLLIEAKEVGNA